MENQALSGGVSAILQSGLILENIRRMFSPKLMYIVLVAQIESKNILQISRELDQGPVVQS